MDDYPVGSEYAIRVTGRLYNYLKPMISKWKMACNSKDTRFQADASRMRHDVRRVIEKCHRGFIEFARKEGYNGWVLQIHEGNIFIVFYRRDD